MAPMIDMVFLLLVFFMTVSSLARDERRPLALPESDAGVVPEAAGARGTISLEAGPDDTVRLFLGAAPIAGEDLEEALRAGLEKEPELSVTIRAPEDLAFAEVRKVLERCAAAGCHRLTFAAYRRD